MAGARDFDPFLSWPSFNLGDEPNSADPPGNRVAYRNHAAPAGAHAYAVGTMIVKTIRRDAVPQDWDLFAMAKRGGDFDPSEATGWEFFLLKMNADGSLAIVSRGSILDDGDMGMAYGGTGAIFCAGCHGAPGTAATDHVLSPQLAPGS